MSNFDQLQILLGITDDERRETEKFELVYSGKRASQILMLSEYTNSYCTINIFPLDDIQRWGTTYNSTTYSISNALTRRACCVIRYGKWYVHGDGKNLELRGNPNLPIVFFDLYQIVFDEMQKFVQDKLRQHFIMFSVKYTDGTESKLDRVVNWNMQIPTTEEVENAAD